MRIFVANPTMQHIDFNYRVPEFTKNFSTVVPALGQAEIPIDLNETQCKAVTDQLQAIGAVPESDVASINNPRAPIFSIRKPVSTDKIDEGVEEETEARQAVSDAESEKAAMVTSQTVAGQLHRATTEVRQLQNGPGEAPEKGGVDLKVTVSTDAGAPERSRG